jgi:hypothetical protein
MTHGSEFDVKNVLQNGNSEEVRSQGAILNLREREVFRRDGNEIVMTALKILIRAYRQLVCSGSSSA